MTKRARQIGISMFTTLAIFSYLSDGAAADEERFEITSIKAIRPTLVDTITALQQRDIARAKAAFDAYDSGWNGIEVYVNTRNKDMYRLLELEFQPRIIKALDRPNPDIPELLADVQAMLVKFDEAVSIFGRYRAAADRSSSSAGGDPGLEGRGYRESSEILRGLRGYLV